MRTCRHCNQPEDEALTERCPARTPGPARPHEWTEAVISDAVQERVLNVLRGAFPSALAALALHCQEHASHGDAVRLVDEQGDLNVSIDVVAACVQRELRRRFQKSAEHKGRGT